jgi:hypothetical protein
MANNYRTDQFYGFGQYEPGVADPSSIGSSDNPAFIWPPASYRDGSSGLQTPLKRGYMRMLAQGYGTDATSKKLAARRFHFQFNPDVLVRSVQARNDVQFWMNQDPSQFVNPIPGDANFAFEFILNREAEVATGSYAVQTGGSVSVQKAAGAATFPGDVSKIVVPGSSFSYNAVTGYDQRGVADIGVLADLMVLDQIIGQGMNEALLSKLSSKVAGLADAYNKEVTSPTDDTTKDTQDKTDQTIKMDKVNSFLTGNIGNSAFLIAQPIRIVFSSLFMVEGFISSSQVTFNKFNLAMVPTQCTVSLNMQAMYIGFATKDTFLTAAISDVLEDGNNPDGSPGGSTTEEKQLTDIASKIVRKVVEAKTSYAGRLNPNPFDSPSIKKELKVSDMLSSGSTTTWEVSIEGTDTYENNKDVIKDVSATLQIGIVYAGRQGTTTVGGDFPAWNNITRSLNPKLTIAECLVHATSTTSQVSFDSPRPLVNSTPTSFSITKALKTAETQWDTDGNAQYIVQGIITFDVEGNGGASVPSTQYAEFKTKPLKLSDFVTGNSFSMHLKTGTAEPKLDGQ